MAFIGESRKDPNSAWGIYVCLDAKECELLMKAVGPLVGRCLRSLEYYKGKMDLGEATEKDTDKLYQAQEDFESITSIRDTILQMKELRPKESVSI